MPVFNQEAYIAAAVRSILEQTFRDFEFIIVDDGSTDRTVEIIEGFEDQRIRLVRASHEGFLAALKRANREASGKWVARMDSDDLCRPNRLERQIGFLAEHPECSFVTTIYGLVTPNHKLLVPAIEPGWCYLDPRDITLSTHLFCDPGTVYDRELALQVGYDDRWRNNEKALWYKLMRHGRGALLKETLYFIRWRVGSLSRGRKEGPTSDQMRAKYDPENAILLEEKSFDKNNLTYEKRSICFYAAAGDLEAAREIVRRAWKRFPFNRETLKLFLMAFGVYKLKQVRGPAETVFTPEPSARNIGTS